MANPLPEGPFDYVYDIAFVNFPINGWLLLAVYILIKRLLKHPPPISAHKHFLLFITSVGTISFIGAIVDGAAYATYTFSVYLVATVMIGLVVAIVASRYVRMEFKASLLVGVFFFAVNLAAWSFFNREDITDIAWFYSYVVWAMYISFIIALIIVSIIQSRGLVKTIRYTLDPWSSTEPDYQMNESFAHQQDVHYRLVLESLIVCFAFFLLMFLSYEIWAMRFY